MGSTLVSILLNRVSTVLQDQTKIRWTDDELLDWLNEAYQQIILLRPDARTETVLIDLIEGTKQNLPEQAVRFLTLTRNENGQAITEVRRSVLDEQVRNWHGSTPNTTIQHFVFNPLNPRVFYVYPPATSTAKVEAVYAAVPAPHSDSTGTIKLDDRFSPAILDFMLYRAYQKDADYAANDQRSQMAYQTFLNSLGVSAQQQQ